MQEHFFANEQIIYQGHTPDRVWRALEQRSRETRRKIDLLCPVCEAEIYHNTATNQQCLSCSAPVEIYQHREHTETADTRIIYSQVKGHRRAVLSLDLHCLSCEQTLLRDETCENTCETQTYLRLEIQDGHLYITRWVNFPELPRQGTDIPIRPLPDNAIATRATDTPNTENQQPNQPQAQEFLIEEHPNAHTDIAAQIVAYLTDAPNHTAETGEMISAFNCTTEGFNKARKKLLKHGKIRTLARGVYALNLP